MPRCGQLTLLVLIAFTFFLRAPAQVQPCTSGTLANVLGSSCSVGSLTLNFQTFFLAGTNSFQGGVSSNFPITPAQIGFLPVQSGNQAGFKLLLNFVHGPGIDDTSSNAHILQFGYTPQVAP